MKGKPNQGSSPHLLLVPSARKYRRPSGSHAEAERCRPINPVLPIPEERQCPTFSSNQGLRCHQVQSRSCHVSCHPKTKYTHHIKIK